MIVIFHFNCLTNGSLVLNDLKQVSVFIYSKVIKEVRERSLNLFQNMPKLFHL